MARSAWLWAAASAVRVAAGVSSSDTFCTGALGVGTLSGCGKSKLLTACAHGRGQAQHDARLLARGQHLQHDQAARAHGQHGHKADQSPADELFLGIPHR